MQDVDLAIIGGGVAGLSAAVACQHVKRVAHVYEAAPAFKPIGTSLSLWPNAMVCLEDWGLDRKIANSGEPIHQVAWRKPDDGAYFEVPLQEIYTQLGHEGICILRSDLHQHLLDAIPDEQLHTGHELVGCNDTGDCVELSFANGTAVRAKHVIGADGIRTKLGAQLLKQDPLKHAGYGAWLGLSDVPSPNPLANEGCEYIGKDGRLGVFETGHDTRYWFFIANEQRPLEQALLTDPDEVLELMAEWPANLRAVVAGSDKGAVTRVSFFDRKVSATWGRGRITLIGDAVHPFLPNLGQGACQSIEDAHSLAAGLKRGKAGEELTRWLENARLKRVRNMQRGANQVGILAQSNSALIRFVRGLFSKQSFKSIMLKGMRDQFTYLTGE